MFVYLYYVFLYYFALVYGIEIISFADPITSKFIASDSVGMFIFMLIMSSILAGIFSIILHFIYMWRDASNTFLKRFYQMHFWTTFISGMFTIVNIGGETIEEWGFKGTLVDGETKVTYLILFFMAMSNNGFYKTFEKEIVNKLESMVSKMKVKKKE
ncbi:hypothetical protein COF79_27870 [Bacillus toyonensis]|uniref:hypothetical protein n=1 Tax=Bacillus toyonensis TaxID=155322 RepID=UPI000BFE722C|nr:hypothetical protein [Bacillus toyonensis]PHF12730.1 hypothetical protein COF83_23970 [Bacillus toyonensis]PHF20565.1 hypothetical protein COF79_27870 [Bacillus toyonensis]PHF39539.1 hypothetical protein COI39_26625 [Bacillus toyonensis]